MPVVVITTIVVRAAGQSAEYLTWAVFASMLIGGLATVVQAIRIGPVGGGAITVMGASGAAAGMAALALVAGGPPLLGTLLVTSAVCQFVLAARLARLRSVITPLVSGTLLALVAVTVMPLAFVMISRVPESAPPAAAPMVAAITIIVSFGLILRGRGRLRERAPLLGMAAGCIVAAPVGILDFGPVADAPWVGIPSPASLGLDVGFGSEFWILLPGFLFATFVITVRQVGDSVRMQRISHRQPRAVDFRRVQGAVNACGVGTLLSGFAGVLPPWPYGVGPALVKREGMAARSAGVYVGVMFAGLAFVPKVAALVLSLPAPVLGAFLMVIFVGSFIQGLQVAFRHGSGRDSAIIAGLSIWIGAGIQFRALFPSLLATPAGQMLGNGLTTGGIAVLVLTLFMKLTGPRRRRAEMSLREDSLPALDQFVKGFSTRLGWKGAAVDRLRAAAEEALLCLMPGGDDQRPTTSEERRLLVVARKTRAGARLEFTAATRGDNLENELTLLDHRPEQVSERDLSLALLRHHATSVRHQQYRDIDILTVTVDRLAAAAAAKAR